MGSSPVLSGTAPTPSSVMVVADAVVSEAGRRWRRVLLRTPWLTETDDLGAELLAVLDHLPADYFPADYLPAGVFPGGGFPGDEQHTTVVVAVAEKVAVLTSGLGVPAARLRAGWLARRLAGAVRPVGNSLGLSVPEKMQYVIDHVGWARVLLATAAAALTRPFGYPGVFFRVAGTIARDVDGLRGAYPDLLLPPLTAGETQILAHHLAARLRYTVAIVDINDRGGSIRAVSPGGPPSAQLLAALADNPLGHCAQSTPVVVLAPLP